MEKTQQEIQALKDNWLNDPIWDIETTEGFEEYAPELKAFREEWEAKWKADKEERIKLTFKYKAERILDALDCFDDTTGNASTVAGLVIASQQVKATLLLAEQVQRVADELEEFNQRDEAEDNRDFMIGLYKVE